MAINALLPEITEQVPALRPSRLIVPEDRLDEVKRLAKAGPVGKSNGDPKAKDVTPRPLGQLKQYKRVQECTSIPARGKVRNSSIGGEGHPKDS